MKTFLSSLGMSFAMFSIIPMPRLDWKKENMRYMLCCLPFVGIVIALVLWLWLLICRALDFGDLIYAAGVTVLPVLLSGAVHLDGFADTADALSSHAEPQRKREILKDSHTGAFAIIYLVAWFLLYAAIGSELSQTTEAILLLGITHILARGIGALASVSFPGSGETGLLATFRGAAEKKGSAVILIVWIALCLIGMAFISLLAAGISLLISMLCLVYTYFMSRRQFGGMSGDIAGYLITASELFLLLGVVVSERLLGL